MRAIARWIASVALACALGVLAAPAAAVTVRLAPEPERTNTIP